MFKILNLLKKMVLKGWIIKEFEKKLLYKENVSFNYLRLFMLIIYQYDHNNNKHTCMHIIYIVCSVQRIDLA